MTRRNTSTVKVPTKFGSFFVHVEGNQDATGASGVWVSKTQKLEDSAIDDLVTDIVDGVHAAIESLTAK
tara:strand:+ start:258 stop:464 length:207 start_codon:yes stop_codon:yes gene_type:complete